MGIKIEASIIFIKSPGMKGSRPYSKVLPSGTHNDKTIRPGIYMIMFPNNIAGRIQGLVDQPCSTKYPIIKAAGINPSKYPPVLSCQKNPELPFENTGNTAPSRR